jgi:RNA polymerase sigma-70 factor (ECF subfamily)
MISQASRSADQFATRRWSVVMQFADAESPVARDALGELAQRYWYPAYAYIRRSGRSPADAQRLTGELLRGLVGDAPRASQGHYRQFLLAELGAFIGREPGQAESGHPAADHAPVASLEARYQRDHAATTTPEQAFQRSFALVVLHRALGRLRNEAAQTGHSEMYRALEPYLAREPTAAQTELLVARLKLRQVTLVLALKRLRQRLRELAADELADTVTSADDLNSEQDALLDVLGELSS